MRLLTSIDKIEERLRSIPPLRLSSHHEAAHAAIGWLAGQDVRAPGLVVDEAGNGHAMIRGELGIPRVHVLAGFKREADAAATMYIARLTAGYAAEFQLAGCAPPARYRPWESGDYQTAHEYAARYFSVPEGSETVRRAILRGERKCRAMLAQPHVWAAVEDLAMRLETRLAVGDEEACEVLEAHLGFGWLWTGERLQTTADAD